MSGDVVIRVADLGKCYQIYKQPADRLKQTLFRGRRQFYREFWALRGVSFEVRRGETLGIIGRNGSGKSTLLQLLCGTLAPTSGSAQVFGRIAALLELGAGFNPEFTGRENVFLNARILGLTKGQTEERFDKIAAFADIGDFIDQPVKTYSSGMYVRLAFAVVANVDADVLIVDEALAVGDSFFTQKCMRFLRQFRETGTLLFVSHDIGAVLNLCQQAVWLEQGAPRQMGPAKQVCEAYLATTYDTPLSITPPADNGAAGNGDVLKVAQQHRAPLAAQVAPVIPNHMEVFRFDPNSASFGKGDARIVNVQLLNEQNQALTWIQGGERVTLLIQFLAHQTIGRPIMGFFIRDRLGQYLFGENTYETYRQEPPAVPAGQVGEVRFTFDMPLLPAGDYLVCVALSEGTQADHFPHHWINDALAFKSHCSSVTTGLVGIPMADIALSVVEPRG